MTLTVDGSFSYLNLVWLLSAILMASSVGLTVVRLVRGPRTLDRLVATDVLAALLQGLLVIYIVWTLDSSPSPAIVALALLAFVGSVSVAQFKQGA